MHVYSQESNANYGQGPSGVAFTVNTARGRERRDKERRLLPATPKCVKIVQELQGEKGWVEM